MGPSQFDVLQYVDQGKVYDFVHMALAKGKCLGVRHAHRKSQPRYSSVYGVYFERRFCLLGRGMRGCVVAWSALSDVFHIENGCSLLASRT